MAEPQFCTACGGRLEKRWDGGRARLACSQCGIFVYRNPVPVAMALARAGEKLVLVERAGDPLRGFWAPPAGYVELDETPEEAAVREAREESGLEVAVAGIHGIYAERKVGVVLLVYDALVRGGTMLAGDDAVSVGLFEPDDLPPQPSQHARTPIDTWFLSVLQTLLGVPRPGAAIARRAVQRH